MTIYGRSEELVSRCVECDLAEPESLTSQGGSAPGVVDGILSSHIHERSKTLLCQIERNFIFIYHLGCGHTRNEDNTTNTLSQHLKYASMWKLLKPLLFLKGDTEPQCQDKGE